MLLLILDARSFKQIESNIKYEKYFGIAICLFFLTMNFGLEGTREVVNRNVSRVKKCKNYNIMKFF